MDKRTVRACKSRRSEITAEYVVAHARWQESRGRHPSERYKGERNARKSLAMALEELGIYEPSWGDDLTKTAKTMMRIALLAQRDVVCNFNGIALRAKPTIDAGLVVNQYREAVKVEHLNWLASAEYQAEAAEERVAQQSLQNQLEHLMANLPNFADLGAVVDWLGKLQDPLDTRGIVKPWKTVLDIFAQHGFLPNTNTGIEFDPENEDGAAHWLVGQALDGLQSEPTHTIHQIYHRFADEWRQKFGYEDPGT